LKRVVGRHEAWLIVIYGKVIFGSLTIPSTSCIDLAMALKRVQAATKLLEEFAEMIPVVGSNLKAALVVTEKIIECAEVRINTFTWRERSKPPIASEVK
jgi:hypothetical protein